MSVGKSPYQIAPTIIYFFILLCIAAAYILVASTVDATNTIQSTNQVSTKSATVQILSTSQNSQTDHSSRTSNSTSATIQQQNTSSVTEISNTSAMQTDPTVGQVGSSAETISQVQTGTQRNPIALWTAIAFAAVTIGYLAYSLRPSTRQ